jgi:hypothetical protein
MALMRAVRMGLGAALCLAAISCGGGGGGGTGVMSSPPPTPPPTSPTPPTPPTSGNNVVSVIVDQGPLSESVNALFTSVTVCVPGSTTSCQTIDHIQVDTGSYGLRLLAPALTLTLPVETLPNSNNSLVECTVFLDGFSWGPVATADVQIAGETAKSLPVQVIGDSRFPTVPANCQDSGMNTPEDTVTLFGANGILGIGPFEFGCGDCDTNNHGDMAVYYACGTTCVATVVPTNMQEPNPIAHFAADNNGSIIDLPAAASTGVQTLSGSLIFGIDTQSNNQSGTQTVLTVNDQAELTMTFNGQTLANSFIDSGSNGIFFADSNIVTCTAPPSDPTSGIVDFYCPANTLPLGLSIQGANGVMANNLTFGVGNAQTILFTAPTDTFSVLPLLAGTIPAGNPGTFDYGLAFFYGKRVAVAVAGNPPTSVGTGPYIAF